MPVLQAPFLHRLSDSQDGVRRDTGRLRYVFRDFPITSLHPQAKKAHEAAYCAGEQNRYWEMHDILFENSQDRVRLIYQQRDKLDCIELMLNKSD
jgi:protein-disulfide isomerase